MDAAGRARELERLQRAHRACTRCVEAGLIPHALPVFSGHAAQHILLVGQAPGPVEQDEERPFAGRAGRTLMRWFERAGFAGDGDVRNRVYMTAMTTCFPGRRDDGSGDRPPSARGIALCSSWLDGVLELVQPRLVIPVGSMALRRFLPGVRLDDVVGSCFDAEGRSVAGTPRRPPAILPLPHPSGQSRWLNDPARLAILERALGRLRRLAAWAEAS